MCRSHDPGDHVGGRREHQHSANDLDNLVEPQPESGYDTKIAAAAPERPEQIGVSVLVHAENLAIGGPHFRGKHIVDGEAVLADEKSHAAADRDPAKADARGVA